MKPKVDLDGCLGCGTCVALCPDVFQMDNNNKVMVLEVDFEKHKECIEQAVQNCPVQAISIE